MTIYGLLLGAMVRADNDALVMFLLDANESAVGMIHTVHLEVDLWETWFNGRKVCPRRRLARFVWSKDQIRERQRYFHFFEDPKANKDEWGRPLNTGDLLEDETQQRVLRNWDWTRPYGLSDFDQGPLDAWIGPRRPTTPAWFGNPAEHFAMVRMQVWSSWPRQSLREFLASSGGTVTARRDDEGHISVIRVVAPELADSKLKQRVLSLAIYLDARSNYMVCRRLFNIYYDAGGANNRALGEGVAPNMVHELEVVGFQRFGNGLYFPKRARYTYWFLPMYKDPALQVELEATKLMVNAPLPPGALDFRFPENAIVREFPPVNGKVKAYVWGADNRPARVIKSLAELQLPKPARKPGARKPGTRLLLGLLVLGLLLIVVIVCLRWAKARGPSR